MSESSTPGTPERVHPATRAEWRQWLLHNHANATSVWLVLWKKAAGRSGPTYADAVEEALAFGWIDSKAGSIDDNRSMLYFARRKPDSAWSGLNKKRVERMRAAGLMHPSGEAAIAVSVQNGAWSLLDEVEQLIVPPDLESAFTERPGSRLIWDNFPRSVRRGLLEWIMQAKRAPTRAQRVRETAENAARGERAHQYAPKTDAAR